MMVLFIMRFLRAPFGLFYHAAWFTQPHHKEGFINFIDTILTMKDVWLLTNWQAIQWVRDPTPISRLNNFQPFQCDYSVSKVFVSLNLEITGLCLGPSKTMQQP